MAFEKKKNESSSTLKIAEPQCRSVPVADALPQRSHNQRICKQPCG
jgi:hypothetical protein